MNQHLLNDPRRQGKLCGYDKHGVPVYHGDDLFCINKDDFFSKSSIKAYYSFTHTERDRRFSSISIRIIGYKYLYSYEDCHSDHFSMFIKKGKEPFTDNEYSQYFV